MRVPLTFLILLLALGASNGQDWPQFRGVNGNASSESSVPTRWSDDSNIRWKAKLPGRGASSPIVVGQRVFLTAFSGYGLDARHPGDKSDLRLHVICLDRSNGTILWNESIEASPDEQEASRRVVDHGYASSTPACDGEMVYASFGVSGLIAYDLKGNLIWQKELGNKTAGFGSASSPVIYQDLVLINASIESGTLFAFDKKTGDLRWKRQRIVRSWSCPCLAKVANPHPNEPDVELVINQKETIYGLDPLTGEELWSCSGIPDYVVPAPVSNDGVVYCLGGRANRAMAVRLGGRGDVTESHKLWDVPIGANVTSPVYFDGHLYWSSDKGVLNCMNASSGKDVFRLRMPTKSRVYASIVRAADRLYMTTRDAGVQVIAAKPEFEELAVNQLESDEGLFSASPALSGDMLLLRSDAFLYAIGE